MMRYNAIKNNLLPLILLGMGMLLPFSAAHGTVADGVYAYEKGHYQAAHAAWLPYAALGDPNALYNLGQLYRMGRGVETNLARAEEYYRRAAEKGHTGAQRNLGTLYYFGRLGDVDHGKAFAWLSRAAGNGDSRAQLMVGTMYYNAQGVSRDVMTAYAWIYLAAKSGLTTARTALEKLDTVLSAEDREKARILASQLINYNLSPDDVGLMVRQPPEPEEETPPSLTDVKTPVTGDTIAKKEVVVAAPADNFRIQIGSYRTAETAEGAFAQLKKRLPDLVRDHEPHVVFADLGAKGNYYRLQLAPFATKSLAVALCDRLQAHNQGCYVVKSP